MMNSIARTLGSSIRQLSAMEPLMCTGCSNAIKWDIQRRFFAEKKKGKKNAAPEQPKAPKSTSPIPINIYTDGKDPVVLPEDQYPDWLWHMLDPKVTPDEWETKNYTGISNSEMDGILRIKAARRIKEYNASKAK